MGINIKTGNNGLFFGFHSTPNPIKALKAAILNTSPPSVPNVARKRIASAHSDSDLNTEDGGEKPSARKKSSHHPL